VARDSPKPLRFRGVENFSEGRRPRARRHRNIANYTEKGLAQDKALGLDILPTMLALADELIE
jgi:hypothetical protein